jgi:hypothetical protein
LNREWIGKKLRRIKQFSIEILSANFSLVSRNGLGLSIVGDISLSGLQDVR